MNTWSRSSEASAWGLEFLGGSGALAPTYVSYLGEDPLGLVHPFVGRQQFTEFWIEDLSDRIGEYLHCCRFCGCGFLVYCGGVSCADRIVIPLSSIRSSSTCVRTLRRQYFQSARRGQAGDNGVWRIKAQRDSLSKISVTGGC